MGIFAKLFKKNSEGTSSKNVEDFVSLTRVYFQSVIAANLGITNIRPRADDWDKPKRLLHAKC